MKFLFFTLLLNCLGGLASGMGGEASAATESKNFVRVRVAIDQSELLLAAEGLVVQMDGRSVFPAQKGNVQLKLSRIQSGGKKYWSLVANGVQKKVQGSSLLLTSDKFFEGEKEWPAQISAIVKADERFDVVATLDVEYYLTYVLPWEMSLSWPVEALKAQAIAARSYVLSQIEIKKNSHFDVDSTVEDQVFRYGRSKIDDPKNVLNKVLSETSGWVLEDDQGKALKAYYHSDCGGATDEPSVVWGDSTAIGQAKDKGCPLNPQAKWTFKISLRELNERLKGLVPFGEKLSDIIVPQRLKSGRVEKLWLQGSGGGGNWLRTEELRRAVGFSQIKSSKFELTKEGRNLVFVGRGLGHGAGLCQWGSRYLAQRGKSFNQILKHYYSKANLVKKGLDSQVAVNQNVIQ